MTHTTSPTTPRGDSVDVMFDVDGMTCASCALRIERVLKKQDGVEEAVVNFAGREAAVKVSPIADVEALKAAVGRIGYEMQPVAELEERETPFDRYQREVGYQLRNVLLASLFTVPVLILAMLVDESTTNKVVQGLLTAPVVFVFGWQFHRNAGKRARALDANMDTLVSIGTLAAFGYSIWATFADEAVFFETAALIISFILLGRYFEARAKGRATASISRLLELGAKQARVLNNGVETMVPIDVVRPGDLIVVNPGEKVPTDGVINAGRSSFDESLLTGESVPVERGPGEAVFGATINHEGRVIVEAASIGSETAVAQIARMVETAQSTKAPVQKLADRVSSVFVPAVIVLSILVFSAWLAASGEIETALKNAVAVLIIACPCALGLATPTAIMVGTGRGAELGVLYKSAEVFERVRAVDAVAFDKTGTITQGRMQVVAVEAEMEQDRFLQLVASLESSSGHPVARAITLYAEERDVPITSPTDIQNLPGGGLRGLVDHTPVVIGNKALMDSEGLEMPGSIGMTGSAYEAEGRTLAYAGWHGRVRGLIAVDDVIRPDAGEAIRSLEQMGLQVSMITGDNRVAAARVADAVAIVDYQYEVRPEDKIDKVKALQAQGQTVAFVGDGVNDAPALTQADLGIAVGSGTDIAIEAGDIVLLSGSPALVRTAIQLAKKTRATINQNLFWAFFYNTAAIPLAALGFLEPRYAAAAMALSSVSVVANSLRLKRL